MQQRPACGVWGLAALLALPQNFVPSADVSLDGRVLLFDELLHVDVGFERRGLLTPLAARATAIDPMLALRHE